MGFADQFLQGLMAGRAEQERKRREAMIESERRTQTERQAAQDAQQQRVLAQRDALQKLELWKSMPQPEQALPQGQAGPPMPLPVPEVEVPSLVPGGASLRVPPTTMTDLLVRNRAQQDLERTNKLEDYRNQQQVAEDFSKIDLSQVPPEARFGLSGIVDPKVYEGARAAELLREQRAGRAQEAAARREQKEREAEDKRTAMEASADAYVEAARGGQPIEVPAALKPLVQERATKAGVRILKPKEAEYNRDLQDLEALTQRIADEYKPGYVGLLDARVPDMLVTNPALATFRRDVQSTFNQFAKTRSGSAVSMPEQLRLNKELPLPTDNEVTFKAKLAALQQEIKEKRARLLGQDTKPAAAGGDNDPLGLGI